MQDDGILDDGSWGKIVHDFGVVGADELAIKSLACHPVYDVAIDLPVSVISFSIDRR